MDTESRACEYGIGVKNRYAFLNDDADDIPPLTKEEEVKEQPKTVKAKGPVKAAPKQKVVKVSGGDNPGGRNNAKGNLKEREKEHPQVVPQGKGFRGKENEEGGIRRRRAPPQEVTGDDWGEEPVWQGEGGGMNGYGYGHDGAHGQGHGYGAERGGGRRGGGGRGYGSRVFSARGGGAGGAGRFTRRRDFDRISGSDKSGVKPVDKRDGSGARNWGNYKDEITAETEFQDQDPWADSATVPAAVNGGAQGDGEGVPDQNEEESSADGHGKENAEDSSPAKPEEPKVFTLEQWKAMQQPKEIPAFNIRKPNEGEDPSKWKNLVLKKKEDVDDENETYEFDDTWIPQRAGRQKLLTNVGFRFTDGRVERRKGFRRDNQDRDGNDNTADNEDRPQFRRQGRGDGDWNADGNSNMINNERSFQGQDQGYVARGRGGGRGRGGRTGERRDNNAKPKQVLINDPKEFPTL